MAGLIISIPGVQYILTTHLPDEVHVMSDGAQRKAAVSLQVISITWSFMCRIQKRGLFLLQSETMYRYRCFVTGCVEWSTSSVNVAHLPGIRPLCKRDHFSLPSFLVIICISPCSKIIFKCDHTCCPLNNFISAKYF